MGNNGKKHSIYKRTLLIAIPVMVQNLITNFVAMIDNIMVGQIGTEQMSGVAIVNQLLFVFNITIFGAVSGAGIFSAQFFGKKDYKGARDSLRFKILTVSIMSLLGIMVFLLFGDDLIRVYLHDADKGIDLEATFGYAKQYMAVMLFGLIPFAFENAYSSSLREDSNAVVPMAAGIAAVITNTVLNYLLIFGIGPFPTLGVVGAGIATVISRFVQTGIVMIWTHVNAEKMGFVSGLYLTLKVPLELAKRIFIKGLIPLMSNEFLWSASIATLAQCYSLRGIDVVAGQNISNTVVNLFNVMFIAFGSGVSVVIGQLLGANNMDGAKKAAPKLIWCSFLLCVGVGSVMAVCSKLFPMVYNTTDDVRALAAGFILISAVTMPLHGMLHCIYFTLRSGGKTLITFLFDSGFSWLISVPTVFCLAHFTNLNVLLVYLICQLLEAVKCFIGYLLIKSGIWLSNIVEENKKTPAE